MSKRSSKPLIAIMMNVEEKPEKDGGYSDYPWYALRREYEAAVAKAGGLPVHVGPTPDVLEDLLAQVDGIVLTGADLGSPEEAYTTGIDFEKLDGAPRFVLEMDLIRRAYEKDLPLFGICAGMQHMNLAFGGTLHHDVTQGTEVIHKDLARHEVKHEVRVEDGSKLAQALGATALKVNSNHREAVAKVGEGLTLSATAPDGVVEGIEDAGKSFFVGVQWHPEFVLSGSEEALWTTLVTAAAAYRKTHHGG
jgi:putative glutamine amidotransferase